MKAIVWIIILFGLILSVQAKHTAGEWYRPGSIGLTTMINSSGKDSDIHLKDFVRPNLDNFKLYPWFSDAYKDYQPDAHVIDSLSMLKDHISIIVFGGSWCSDTHDLLPRFYKTVERAKIPADKITLIGVDRRKHSHDGRSFKYRIKRVPTFIFFYDGKQIGRVVESVQKNIETDMLNQYHKAGY